MMNEGKNEIFSKQASAGKRTYFFDIVETETGNQYLKISESKLTDEGFERYRILIEEKHYVSFFKAIKEVMGFVGVSPSIINFDEIRKHHPRAYEKWTKDEEEKLSELYNDGKNTKEISKYLERQPGAIKSRLQKLGLVGKNY